MKQLVIFIIIVAFSLNTKPVCSKVPVSPKQEEIKSFEQSQFIGKWYLWSRSKSKKSKFDTAAEGKFLALKKDGTYTSDALDKTKAGQWTYNEKTKILVLKNDKTKTTWDVINVNDFGLVLINRTTQEKWRFALEG